MVPPGGISTLISVPYVYVMDPEEELLVVVDVSDARNPYQVGQFQLPGEVKAVSDSCPYLADRLGLRVMDMSDPSNVRTATYYETKWGVEGVSVSGEYAYLAAGEGGLRVLDISDPSNPREVASCEWRRRPAGWVVEREVTRIPPGAYPATTR